MEEINEQEVEVSEEQTQAFVDAAKRLSNLTMGEWQFIRKNSGFGRNDLAEDFGGVMQNEDFLASAVVVYKKREGNKTFGLPDAYNLTIDEALAVLGFETPEEDADPKA